MTSASPNNKASVRQVKSQRPISIESTAPWLLPGRGKLPGGGTSGISEALEKRPGTSPPFCQLAMPSVQTSVSMVTVPLVISWRNCGSG